MKQMKRFPYQPGQWIDWTDRPDGPLLRNAEGRIIATHLAISRADWDRIVSEVVAKKRPLAP